MRTLAIALALLTLLACSSASVPAELVGTWRASGPIGDPGEPGPAWTKTYKLHGDGTFVMSYPPIQVKGSWKVAERDGDRFRIVLTDQKMSAGPGGEVSESRDSDGWAVLEGGSLRWDNAVYSRGE